MSQILKGFVDALNHPRGHLQDLEVLGVTTDGRTPGVGWEELPSPTFPDVPDGERVFATNLSRLGIGWDEKARVLYLGVVFGRNDLVALPGQAAKTKSRLRRGVIYGEVAISPRGDFLLTPGLGPLGALLSEAYHTELPVHLVGQFNDWRIEPESRLRFVDETGEWKIGQAIDEESLAKIAIPMPPAWRGTWNSGHHRPGITQVLRLWPASSNG